MFVLPNPQNNGHDLGLQLTTDLMLINTWMCYYRVYDSDVSCNTSAVGKADSSFSLIMSFDGAERMSTDFFTYRANPEIGDVERRDSINS